LASLGLKWQVNDRIRSKARLHIDVVRVIGSSRLYRYAVIATCIRTCIHRATHGKQYALYAIGCNWKNMVVETGRVLSVRANRIEKSDADFALFVHVARFTG